ncbi:unnamed protein product [Cylicocyclus nassatus]|uniref:Uncharacterized protein n=1 Tax=Cylicocyclus nassatus TaxID=53992 RepID=A0AA36H2H2_CYLNA|nr:unnamed protein product [Cylicocyclus nassatus]
MYLICSDTQLRDELLQKLALSENERKNKVFSTFTILPSPGDIAVLVADINDENLRSVIRYLLANAEKKLGLAVVKRKWSDNDSELLDEAIQAEYSRAHEENQKAAQKVSRLPSGSWKNDRIEQLRAWQDFPTLNYATFSLGDDIKKNLESFFGGSVQISLNDNNEDSVSSKPPVLHWTPLPLDSEIQVLIRITFYVAGPDNATFTDIRKSLHGLSNFTHEWKAGILLIDDPVRLHVERTSPTQIEIAARLCVDELEEDQMASPSKLLWPYIAVALRNALQHLNEHRYLQYSLELIPYGATFFDPPVHARVFDLSQFMGTACAYNKVAFRYDEKLCNVHLDTLLSGQPFKSLQELLALEKPQTKQSQNGHIEAQNHSRPESKKSSNAGLNVSHNRGRRVSFGSIKLMDEGNSTVKGVDDYVDAMLKHTIDHLVL